MKKNKSTTAYNKEEGVLYGQVVYTVRTSAENFLAFMMHSDSRIFTKYERGSSTLDMATLEVVPNNRRTIVYFLSSAPQPFLPREFLGHITWRQEGEKQYFIANVPADHEKAPLSPDYVRAESVRATRIVEESPGVTTCTLTFTMDLKGLVPSWITRNIVIPANLEGPAIYQKYFLCILSPADFDKDGEDATMLAHIIMNDVYSHKTVALREAALQQYFVRAACLRTIEGKYPWFPVLLWHAIVHNKQPHSQEEPLLSCLTPLRAFTSNDAKAVGTSIARCMLRCATPKAVVALWLATHPAMAALQDELEEDRLDGIGTRIFRPFLTQVVAHLAEKKTGAAGRSTDDEDEWEEFAAADELGRQVVKKTFPDLGQYSADETRSFELSVGLEMRVSKYYAESHRLSPRIVATLSGRASNVSLGENTIMSVPADKKDPEVERRSIVRTVKEYKCKHSLLEAYTAVVDGIHCGFVTCSVRADAADVLAFCIDIQNSNFGTKYDRSSTTKEIKVLDVLSPHHVVTYARFTTPFGDRDFVGSTMWRRETGGDYIYINVPTAHDKVPTSLGVVRGEAHRVWRMHEVSPGLTQLSLTFTMDLKGEIPRAITRDYVYPATMEAVAKYPKYFLLIKPAFDKDGEDATMLARFMCEDIFAEVGVGRIARRRAALHMYFVRAASLRSLSVKYPWLELLLWNIIQNKVRPASSCITALRALTSADAEVIGKAFAFTLLGSLSAATAADEWTLEFPAMRELASEVDWFQPFVATIAWFLLNRVSWGRTARVFAGALLSTLDMTTDLVMIVQFYRTGYRMAAIATIVMISLAISITASLIRAQNTRKSRLVIAREVMIALSGLKPAVDAYRLCYRKKKDPLLVFDPLQELMFSKLVEVGIEAIGGCVLQASILIRSPVRTPLAIFSLTTSAMSIACSVTTVFFDYDTAVSKRRESPEVWGAIPDRHRGIVFALMVLMSTCQILSKVFSIALLAVTRASWLVIWLCADVLLFLVYKIARREFVYLYPPGVQGGMKYVTAFFARVLVKIIADVTGLLLLRGPYEMGGFYFSFNMVLNIMSCWIAQALYSDYYEEEDSKIDSSTICAFIGALQLLWALATLLFFRRIKRKYLRTFYSTQSARQASVAYFLESDDDSVRLLAVFTTHEDLWSDIKDQVKAYMLQNWETWERDQPAWFDGNFKATVPDEFIPKVALDTLNKLHGGVRRRSSVGLVVAGVGGSERRGSAAAVVAPEPTS